MTKVTKIVDKITGETKFSVAGTIITEEELTRLGGETWVSVMTKSEVLSIINTLHNGNHKYESRKYDRTRGYNN